MRRSDEAKRLPELLSPAGSYEALTAAVDAGADAVYLGAKRFSARAYAHNFDMESIERAVHYCRTFGVRCYIALNTLVYEKEMPELVELAADMYRVGADALIMADVGAIRAVRRYVPDMAVHASTQLTVHSTGGLKAAAALGVKRAVLARELSREDIIDCCRAGVFETEMFVHGALCVCYSGQCLFSSIVGGRSGNRGECAQPCRLPYSGGYPLSLRDLSLASHIPELIDIGVDSLKIEGRMKSPEYVYTVTGIYRRLLDERRAADSEESERLRAAFSRGGFTDGYFTGRKYLPMTGIRSERDKEDSRAAVPSRGPERRRRINAELTVRASEPASLIFSDGRRSVTVSGVIPEPAVSSPVDAAGAYARLSKLGGTGYMLSESDFKADIAPGLNLSPATLNAMRRAAVEKLCEVPEEVRTFRAEKYVRPDTAYSSAKTPSLRRTALFLDGDSYFACEQMCRGFFDAVFIPFRYFDRIKDGFTGIYVPPIMFDREEPEVSEALSAAAKNGAKYALVGNIGHISLALRCGLVPVADFRSNITNPETAEYYRGAGARGLILSPELTLPQMRDIGGIPIVYGRLPLMLTERCFIKENFGCAECGKSSLTDRIGKRFPLFREYPHRNLVLNSVPVYMGDRKDELAAYGMPDRGHFIFSVESAKECSKIIDMFIRGAKPDLEVRRIQSKKQKAN